MLYVRLLNTAAEAAAVTRTQGATVVACGQVAAPACGEERKGERLKEERDLGMCVRLLLWKAWCEREREN